MPIAVKNIDINWIQSLKPGDEVAYAEYCSALPQFIFSKVTRVSPGGNMITLESGLKFNQNGFERTARTYSKKYIADPKTVREYQKQKEVEYQLTMKTREIRTRVVNRIGTLDLEQLEKLQSFLESL